MSRSSERLCLIVNPRSAAGATAQRLGRLRRAADRHFREWEVWQTEGPGHGSALAARAALEGFDVVVAVGGDGTASEVANGLCGGCLSGDEEGEPAAGPERPIFGVIPAGTGSDLVKTLGMPRDLDAAMEAVATLPARAVDVTRVEMAGAGGEKVRRIGLNVTGFGMNGEVVRRANASSKRLGGLATFALATLQAMASWEPIGVRVAWIDGEGAEGTWEGALSSVFVANGHFCGGGMWVGRGGAMDDGLLDVTIIPDLPRRRLLLGGHRLFSGTMDHVKGVSRHRVRRISAAPVGDAQVLVDVDGEQPGVLPINVEVVPKALLVRGEWLYARK